MLRARTTRDRAVPIRTPQRPGRGPRRAARTPVRSGTRRLCASRPSFTAGNARSTRATTRPVESRIEMLPHERRQVGRIEASREQFLEPGLGHSTFLRHGVEQAEQGAGAGLSRPVQTLSSCAERLQVDMAPAGIRQCLADSPSVVNDRAEVRKRSTERGAQDACDHRDISLLERRDVMDHRIRHANSRRSRDACLDDGHPGVVEAVEPVQPGCGAVRHERLSASGEDQHHQPLMPRRRRSRHHEDARHHLLEPAGSLGRRDAGRESKRCAAACWRVNARCCAAASSVIARVASSDMEADRTHGVSQQAAGWDL